MSLIIIGKVVLSSLVVGAVSVGGVFLHRFLNPNVEIYGFISVSETAITDAIKCHLDKKETESFSCSLSEITKLSSDDTKPVLLTEFNGDQNSQPIKATDTLEKTKFYKISISQADFSDKAKSWATKPITVYGSTTLGTMSAMFVVKNGKVITKSSSSTDPMLGSAAITSFVGQASKPIAANDITDYKCAWSSEASNFKACKIFSFFDESVTISATGTKIGQLKLQSNKTEITKKADEIKENHYYLIQFTNDTKKLSEFHPEDLIYAKNTSSADGTQVTFSKISAVAEVEKQLLILNHKK